ncbi:hypothetical protein G6F31_018685 [Rhizopus arrhizus]|nr:hypothetical protein G6F31_018685 [Rhizopus arrhizus]
MGRAAAVDDRVVAVHAQDLAGAFFAIGARQRLEVRARHRIALGGARVEDAFHIAVAGVVGAQFQLFPELVGFAVAVHDVQLERHFAYLLGLVAGRGIGRFMRHAGMHRVVQVLVEHLPVRALHHPEDAARDLDLAHRGPVAQIVDGRAHAAQEVRQCRAFLRLAGEHEAAVACHARQPARR